VRVGGLDVRVRPDHRGHAAVQPARERDLLARGLGVDIHDDERRLRPRTLDQRVDHLEHRRRRVQEEGAEDVQDGEPGRSHRDEREAGARREARRVRGSHDPVGRVQVRPDLRAPERVVAERDRVRPCLQEPVGETGCDAHAVRRVLAVDHARVRPEFRAERRETGLERLAAGCADDVRDEEDAQCRAFYRTSRLADG